MKKKVEERPVQPIALNRSKKLEGKPGFYDGKPITSRYVGAKEVANTTSNGVIDIYGDL